MGAKLTVEEADAWLEDPARNRSTEVRVPITAPDVSSFEMSVKNMFDWSAPSNPATPEQQLEALVSIGWAECGDLSPDHEATLVVHNGIGACRYGTKMYHDAALPACVRVICVDYPGVGSLSQLVPQEPGKQTTLDSWVHILHDLLLNEGVIDECTGKPYKPLHIAGFSAGGLFASHCVSHEKFHGIVSSLSLLAPWVPPSWEGSRWFAKMGTWTPGLFLSAMSAIMPAAASSSIGFADGDMIANMLDIETLMEQERKSNDGDLDSNDNREDGNGNENDDDHHEGKKQQEEKQSLVSEGHVQLVKRVLREARASGSSGYSRVLNICLEKSNVVVIPTIELPTLLIVGTKDKMVSEDGMRTWKSKLPNCSQITIDGASHDAIGSLYTKKVISFITSMQR